MFSSTPWRADRAKSVIRRLLDLSNEETSEPESKKPNLASNLVVPKSSLFRQVENPQFHIPRFYNGARGTAFDWNYGP